MKEKIKRLQQAIELAKRNISIFINGFMITNFRYGIDKVIGIDFNTFPSFPTLDIIVNGIVEFSIPIERITSIETISEVLYKE